MRYLKTYESDDWRRKTNNQNLKDLSYELDDILDDISDEGFPHVQPSLVDDKRQSINIELTASEDGSVSGHDEFPITPIVESTLRRLQDCATSNQCIINIGLYFIYPSEAQTDVVNISYDGSHWIVDSKDISSGHERGDYEEGKALDIIGIDVDFVGISIYNNIKKYEEKLTPWTDLNTYKLFEDVESSYSKRILDTISDCLIDVKQNDMEVTTQIQDKENIILIYITNRASYKRTHRVGNFSINDIRDSVNRLISTFSEDNHPLISFRYMRNDNWSSLLGAWQYPNIPEELNISDMRSFELKFKL